MGLADEIFPSERHPDLVQTEWAVGWGYTSIGFEEAARITGASVDVFAAIEKLVGSKLQQLSERIAEFVEGAPMLPRIKAADVAHVWPVLVLDNPIMQTESLWHYIAQSHQGLFRSAKTMRPTILGIDDLEFMCALVEQRGVTIAQLLDERMKSEYANFDYQRWLRASPYRDAPRWPRFVSTHFDAATTLMRDTLWPGRAGEPFQRITGSE